MTDIEKLKQLIVSNPAIPANSGELCFFSAKGQLGTPRQETTTTVKPGLGIGVTVPVTKHFGIGIGKHKVKTDTTTRTIWEKVACHFVVFSERMAISVNDKILDIDLSAVEDIIINKDAVTILCKSENYYVFMSSSDIKSFANMFQTIQVAYQNGIDYSALLSDVSDTDNTSYSKTDAKATNTLVKPVNGDYSQTAFLWSVGRKAMPIRKRDEYPSFLFYDCGIQNAPKYHQKMVDEGFLQPASAADYLSTLKVGEIKEILQKNGLVSSGKKADLIQRATEHIPMSVLQSYFPEKNYVLSDKGTTYLNEHDDYVKLRIHSSWQISVSEFDSARAKAPNAKFNDICWGIFNQQISKCGVDFYPQRNIYYNMYLLLQEEGRNADALMALLRVLYLDASGTNNPYIESYKKKWLSKLEFYERLDSELAIAPGIVKEIGNYQDVFSVEMIDKLYRWTLPIQMCPKALFEKTVRDIIDGTYDEIVFKQKMITEYKKLF